MVDMLTALEEDVEFEGIDPDDSISPDLPQEARSIHTRSADPEIESLYRRWKKGRLILQPDFQRQFVWDRPKASRLIESVLLEIPLPIIYLAEEEDGTESVIDGQQRLTSFFSYIDGQFPNGDVFSLSGMRVFKDLNRVSFCDIDETLQEKITAFPLRVVTILKESNSDLKFEIFERLNTGAVPLNAMEIRNCIYRGPYMRLLRELAHDPDFTQLIGFKKPDSRMRDVELVLRFATFYHETYLKYQSPMKRFLNRDMEKYRNIDPKDAEELRKAFRNALQIIKSLFGASAFKRFYAGTEDNPDGSWETKRFNASLYDVMMGVFAGADKNRVFAALDAVREGLIDLMTSNSDFINAILLGTSEVGRVQRRFDLARARVNEILDGHGIQPRCFSRQLKQDLFDQDPTCAICGNRIQVIDDAAVDHIQQYWQGGKTIPENARLAHRYCNNSRPRKE